MVLGHVVLEHVTVGHVGASVGDAVGLALVGVVCQGVCAGKVVRVGGHSTFIFPAG